MFSFSHYPPGLYFFSEKEGKKEEENEEAEDVYCKLNDPAENVYMTTMSSSTAKHNKGNIGQVQMYLFNDLKELIVPQLCIKVV